MKNILLKLKNYAKSLTILKVIGILVIFYIGISIYKEIRPLSYQEKYIQCLKLSSEGRVRACVDMLKK